MFDLTAPRSHDHPACCVSNVLILSFSAVLSTSSVGTLRKLYGNADISNGCFTYCSILHAWSSLFYLLSGWRETLSSFDVIDIAVLWGWHPAFQVLSTFSFEMRTAQNLPHPMLVLVKPSPHTPLQLRIFSNPSGLMMMNVKRAAEGPLIAMMKLLAVLFYFNP